MEQKRITYIISIVLVTILACVFAFTFAYIGRPTVGGNANINVNILANDVVTFKYTGATTMTLNVALSDVTVENAANNYTKYKITSSTNTTVQLTSNETVFPNGVTCDYDIIYTPTVPYVQTSTSVAAGLRELVLRGKIGSTYFIDDTNIAGSNPIKVYTRTIATSSSSNTKSEKWQFYVRFYNLNVDQSEASGQNPKGVISIENPDCHGL